MKELLTMIGKTGTYTIMGWPIKVTVLDVKNAYGVDKLYVTDTNSSDGRWINRDSFQEDKEEEKTI